MTGSCAEPPGGSPGRGGDTHAGAADLARLCLPSEYRDPARTLAWANSICLLFVLVGIAGLKAPEVRVRPLPALNESVPVLLETEPQPLEPEMKPAEATAALAGEAVEVPQVVPVAAVVNAERVAFPVPVEKTVAVVQSAAAAPPPPRTHYVPPRPVAFRPDLAGSDALTPPPTYPPSAVRNRYEGAVIIEFGVDAAGMVHSAKVRTSSGFRVLDEAALGVVRDRWRFPAGNPRAYYWSCTFELK